MSVTSSRIDFREVESCAEFHDLKKKHRSIVLPLSIFFLTWYFLYVLLGAYAHDFMAIPVFGTINIGILLGFGQFLTTFIITMIYVRRANSTLDPAANSIRLRLEELSREAGTTTEVPGDETGQKGEQ